MVMFRCHVIQGGISTKLQVLRTFLYPTYLFTYDLCQSNPSFSMNKVTHPFPWTRTPLPKQQPSPLPAKKLSSPGIIRVDITTGKALWSTMCQLLMMEVVVVHGSKFLQKHHFLLGGGWLLHPGTPQKIDPNCPQKEAKGSSSNPSIFRCEIFLLVAGRVHIGRFSASKSIRDQCRFDRLNPSFDRIMAPRFRPVGWKKKPWA